VASDDAVVFYVPDTMLEDGEQWVLRFLVGVFGGEEGYRTDAILMRRGDEIRIRVASVISRTVWSKHDR